MKCSECGQRVPVVDVQEIDRLMCTGGTFWWNVPVEELARVRGLVYYSAEIHYASVRTSYKDGVLAVTVTR